MSDRETAMTKFANFVRNKRMALGISQREFAVLLYGDVRRITYISAIENGKVEVSLATVDLMLQALNSDIEFLE